MRRLRYDYASRLDFAAALPSPSSSSATKTPEGYLLVDGYLARSGLLEYSDGLQRWTEYRPKDELRRAAITWTRTPITDGHPDGMVDSSSWAQLAKGHVLQSIAVETLGDGQDYLRATLLITDADLVQKVTSASGPKELSIGFSSMIENLPGGIAPDGVRCDAIQRELSGNHIAVVAIGRAGPSARLLMDGAAFHTKNPRHDMKTKRIYCPMDGRVFFDAPLWLAKAFDDYCAAAEADVIQPKASPPTPAPAAPAAQPQTAELTIDGETHYMTPAMADWYRRFFATPEGQRALDERRRTVAADAAHARANRAFLLKQGYTEQQLDDRAEGEHLRATYERTQTRKRLAEISDRGRADSASSDDEVDAGTLEFLKRQGY